MKLCEMRGPRARGSNGRPGHRPWRIRAGRCAAAALATGAALLAFLASPAVFAYFEDLDEPTTHSTFHYELTRLLARAAGFPIADAELIAVVDQAVDLLSFTGEPEGAPAITLTGTSRYSEVTAKYFHFPRRGAATSAGTPYPGERDSCASFAGTGDPCTVAGGEIAELEAWAMGATPALSLAVPTVSVDGAPAAPVASGSLAALAIYLHSLADSYSHEKCGQDARARRHCLPTKPDCPVSCTTELWHGQSEYGAGGAGVPFTQEAGRAVWQELRRYRAVAGLPGGPLWDDAAAAAFVDAWADTQRATTRREMAIEAYAAIATCAVDCSARAAAITGGGLAIDFAATATPASCAGVPIFTWDAGDGSAPAAGQTLRHAYPAGGTYSWSLTVVQDGAMCSAAGSVTVPAAPLRRRLRPAGT